MEALHFILVYRSLLSEHAPSFAVQGDSDDLIAELQAFASFLDGLDLEMGAHQGEHHAFQILQMCRHSSLDDVVDINAGAAAQLANTDLHKVVKDPQTIRVFALLYLHKGPQLRGAERDVLVPKNNLELLPAYSVRCRPFIVILLQYLQQDSLLSSI